VTVGDVGWPSIDSMQGKKKEEEEVKLVDVWMMRANANHAASTTEQLSPCIARLIRADSMIATIDWLIASSISRCPL